MKNLYIGMLILAVAMVFTDCVPRKKMVYLQTAEGEQADSTLTHTYNRSPYHLQKGDIVDVQVRSLEPQVNEVFNPNAQNFQQAQLLQSGGAGDLYYMTGYSVDDSGRIELPLFGYIQAEGLTIEELKDTVDVQVDKYFKTYFLQVRLGGIRYSAIGEFNRPGKYTILQNQATIFDAISNAGDLNMVAMRDNVKLIRQYPEGTKVHTVNLLDESIISSPYYFIQPNDVIYVEPLPAKSWGIGTTGAQTAILMVSLLSSIALIYSSIAR